jgi:hypothetical protein
MYEHMSEYVQEVRQEEHGEIMKDQDSTLNTVKKVVQDNKG